MQPETKLHYRMYKDGKNWVFAAVALAFFGVGAMTTTVHAADVTTTDQAPIEKPASAPTSQASSAAASQTSAGSEKASTPSEATSVASSAKSDVASNSGAVKSTTNEVESGTTSTASADKSDTKVSDQQSQTSDNDSSVAKSDAQSVNSVASQAAQASQSAAQSFAPQQSQSAQSVTSQASQETQTSSNADIKLETSIASQVSTQSASVKARTLDFAVVDTVNNTDTTATANASDTSTDNSNNATAGHYKTAIAADGQTITISPDNFDDYFVANGSATYKDGKVSLTTATDQSGNITLRNQIDPNYSFTVNGGVSMSVGQTYVPDIDKETNQQKRDSKGNLLFKLVDSQQNADGISFIFHTGDTNMVGGSGGSLGIAGLKNAFGFKVDNYFNGDDTNVHENFYPDPVLDRDGKIIANGDSFGAFVYTNGDGTAATYGGPNGTVYTNPEIPMHWNFSQSEKVLANHISVNNLYTTSVANKDTVVDPKESSTLDQNAGAELVNTPSITNGNTIPIKMVYEPYKTTAKDLDGNDVEKTEHILTVFYGGDNTPVKDANGNVIKNSDGTIKTVTLQPVVKWSVDVTPWLTKKADGTYEALSFAMAASTGAVYNIQNMNYEAFNYVSDAVVPVKLVTEDSNGKQTVIPESNLVDQTIQTSAQLTMKIGEKYTATAPLRMASTISKDKQAYEYKLIKTPENVTGFANVLNQDVVFVYELTAMSAKDVQTVNVSGRDVQSNTQISGTEPKQLGNAEPETQTGNITSDLPWKIPAGYTLVTDSSSLPKGAEMNYSVTSNGQISVALTGQNQDVTIWLAPIEYGDATIQLVDATKSSTDSSRILKTISHYNNGEKVFSTTKELQPYSEDKIEGYLPIDPNVQHLLISNPKNRDFTFYYVPAPTLEFGAKGQNVSTQTELSFKDKSFLPETKKESETVNVGTQLPISEKDNRTNEDDKTIIFTVDQQKDLLGTNLNNYDLSNISDVSQDFQSVPTANFDAYKPNQVKSLSYNAKPVTLNLEITSTDNELNTTVPVHDGTLLGNYKVSLPETISVGDVTYKLVMKDTYSTDVNGNAVLKGTYNLNDAVMSDTGLTQTVEVNYIRQTVVNVKDVVTGATTPNMLSAADTPYSENQNFVSIVDETGTTLTGVEGLKKVKVTGIVDLSKAGTYVLTFAPENGKPVTAETHVVEIVLKNKNVEADQPWSLDDVFVSGTRADGTPMKASDLNLLSTVDTKVVANNVPIIVCYGDPVYARTFINIVPKQVAKPDQPTKPDDPKKGVTTPEQPATTPEAPATTPEKPATTPETPATTPEQPVTTPETPVTTPEKPATTPEKPATTPEKPVTTPEAPVTTPEQPATVAETPTPVEQPITPVQTPDVPAEQTTPTEPTQPATVENVTPNVPTQPVLTPTVTDQPTTPVSSDRPWDPIELLMTDDDNGQIITTTEIQGYTGNWVYIGNMIPAGYHLAPGQSDWILLNDVTPQTVHLVANTVDQTSTAVATQTTVASAATAQTVAPVAQQSVPATVAKEASAPTTKTTDETDQSAAAELPHTGELATTAAMGTGLALLTGLFSLFGLRRKQH